MHDDSSDIKPLTDHSFIYSLSFTRTDLTDFTGGSRIHDLVPLQGSPWELCCLQVLLVKYTILALNLDTRNICSFFTSQSDSIVLVV